MSKAVHFSDAYGRARARFVDAAERGGFSTRHFLLPALRGPSGEELTMDVAWAGPAAPRSLIVISSGTHGVEGYAGSAVQAALAGDAGWAKDGGTALALVHAINPHGFAHGRRVNEDNVDLNRNFRDFARPRPRASGYERLHKAVVPPAWTGSERRAADAALARARDELGSVGFQAAVCQGQYRHADGLFFGGGGEAWSNRTLRLWLSQLPTSIRALAHIDIHTGLGPYGYGEILYTLDAGHAAAALARDWYGDIGLCIAGEGDSAATPVRATMNHAFVEASVAAQTISISLEFGTVEFDRMFEALRADNWVTLKSARPSQGIAKTRAELTACFSPADDAWRAQVIERSLDVIERTRERLIAAV